MRWCSDGRAWTRALLSDTALRLAQVEHRLGNRSAAGRWRRRFLTERSRGASSIYSSREIARTLRQLE